MPMEDAAGRDHYTLGHEQPTLASHGARTAASSAQFLIPHLCPGMTLLDVGCGPGSITLDLAELVAPAQVIGVEYIDAPLSVARDLAKQRGDNLTRFEVGDAQALPFSDNSFDVVYAHQVLQHLTDPTGALREMARVCKPGGIVAVREADYAAMAWFPESSSLDLWRRTYRAAAQANGAEPDAGRRLRHWATEAGLTTSSITSSVWTYADRDACRWWGEGQADRYGGQVFRQQARELGASEAEIDAIAEGWRAWARDPDAWFVILHGELLSRLPR